MLGSSSRFTETFLGEYLLILKHYSQWLRSTQLDEITSTPHLPPPAPVAHRQPPPRRY